MHFSKSTLLCRACWCSCTGFWIIKEHPTCLPAVDGKQQHRLSRPESGIKQCADAYQQLGGGLPANQVARVAGGGAIAPIPPSLPLPNHLAHRQAPLFFFPHAQSRFAKSDDQSPRHGRHRFAIRIPSSTPRDPPSHVSSRCGFCLGCQTRPRQPHPTYAHPLPHPHPHRPTRGQGCRRRRAGSLHAPSD